MIIELRPETQRIIQDRMKVAGVTTADDLVLLALDALDQMQGESIEELDSETQAAIQRATARSARGEGRPWEEVRAEIRAKYIAK
jgi:hypothetical protein